MKKEAVNTFNDGLIMDLNPLTTPSNVMTSCLNGTIVTYNGNEFVLQNDMGNGRVESAYLPAGYVPVGVKEHGGIIYVASYNPLTNKGQIGSFPSPERNISSNEVSSTNKTITPENFEKSTIYKLNLFDDKDLVLRSGDKFSIVIAGDEGDTLSKYISNYLNTGDGKVKSPKNKVLTLKACVIDANNSLRDITQNLKRIDISNVKEGKNYEVLAFENESQIYKANAGYFATPEQFTEDPTQQDLDNYRKNTALNVYNNKVFGQLYIVATLNTIQRIDFSITGIRKKNEDEADTADLTITVTYYYNCPDGFYDKDELHSDEQNKKYENLYDQYDSIYGHEDDFHTSNTIKGIKFTLSESINEQNTEISKDSEYSYEYNDTLPFKLSESNNIQSIEYIESENLYRVKETHKIENVSIQSDNDVREYTAIPAMLYGDLEGLKVSGNINLSKLGTGDFDLTTWKYFCTKDNITLTWGFESYLTEDQTVKDLKFEFWNIKNFDSKVEEANKADFEYSPSKKYNYNGQFTDVLTYEPLEYGQLYLVVVRCEIGDNNQKTFARWLLTTNLYNEEYFGNTKDYNEFTEAKLNNNGTGLNDIRLDISYSTKDVFSNPYTYIPAYNPEFSQNSQTIVGYKRVSKQIQVNSSLKYKNAEKYPFEIASGRYSISYNAKPRGVEWNGIIGGAGNNEVFPEYDEFVDTSSNASLGTDTLKNIVSANVTGDKVLIVYRAPSFIDGKKPLQQRTVQCARVLTSYLKSREKLIFGEKLVRLGSGSGQQIRMPYGLQISFRHKRHGGADYHGYAFVPIYRDSGAWTTLVKDLGYLRPYLAEVNKDGVVEYQARDRWTDFTVEAMKKAAGILPPVTFLTMSITPNTSLGGDFDTWDGSFVYGSSQKSAKMVPLWLSNNEYGILNAASQDDHSICEALVDDLENLYIRQMDGKSIQGYLIDPEKSSYVQGGTFKITIEITVIPQTNNEISAIPEYLEINKLKDRIAAITKFNEQVVGQLAQLMQFKVIESEKLTFNKEIDDKLVDMSPIFSQIQRISENPTIDTPIVIEETTQSGSTIVTAYQLDDNEQTIDEQCIYTITSKNNNKVVQKVEQCNSTQLRKYHSYFKVMLVDGEYHLVPGELKIQSPKLEAYGGSDSARTILKFGNTKTIGLTLSKSEAIF